MLRLLSGALRVDTIEIPIANLCDRLQGTTIVQLSDFHFDGFRLSERMLVEAIEASNAIDPDLVFLTGDFVTDDPQPIEELVLHLKYLRSRSGGYAVLGNHDLHYRRSRDIVTRALERVDIPVLWNQVEYPLGPELALVGLPDFWQPQFAPEKVMEAIAPDIPRVVLSHNPDSAAVLEKWRVDLQLSGHTHGGQIWIPGYGSLAKLLKIINRATPKPLRRFIPYLSGYKKVVDRWEWAAGLHRVGDNWLYVNRGLGTYLPGRLFCPPEVTVIKLVKARSS